MLNKFLDTEVDLDFLDAPTEIDLFIDDIHDKLMRLTGTDIINGMEVIATFDETIKGDDYYTYEINGKKLMNFSQAYDILISGIEVY